MQESRVSKKGTESKLILKYEWEGMVLDRPIL